MKKYLVYILTSLILFLSLTQAVYANMLPSGNFFEVFFQLYPLRVFFPFLFLNLIIEIPISFLFIKNIKNSIVYIIIANVISYLLLFTILWFYIDNYIRPVNNNLIFFFLEVGIVFFEASIIKFGLKKIKFKKILLYTLISNMASVLVGLLLSSIL